MVYQLKKCIVVGVFNPSILLEGWISNDIESLSLYKGDSLIFSETFSNKETKANYFLIHVKIPKCLNIRLMAQCGNNYYELLSIPTHIGKRIWSKFNSKFAKKVPIFEPDIIFDNSPMDDTLDPLKYEDYQQWLMGYPQNKEKPLRFDYNPLISIVIPVYNVKREYLSDCLESILKQSYQNFEICIADDCSFLAETIETLEYYKKKDARIKINYRSENGHISLATNSALELAKGEFVGFLDNDDILDKDALYEVVKVLNNDRNIDFIYTDEDKLSLDGKRIEPHFKPDFAMDNLLAINYICHFVVLRSSLINRIGGMRKGYEGAQDYDLYLRAVENTNRIFHIPKVLYHWRQIPGSTSLDGESKNYAAGAGKRALEDYIKRNHIEAAVVPVENKISYCVKYVLDSDIFIDVVLLYDGNCENLKNVIEEWIVRAAYCNYRIIVFSKKGKRKAKINEYKKIVEIRWIDSIVEFNQYVLTSHGTHLLFWDVGNTIVDCDWVRIMVSYANYEKLGAIGSNVINNLTGDFVSGFIISEKHKIIPVRKWYIAMGHAPVNRCVVGKNGYIVSRKHFLEVGGFNQNLDLDSIHYDLQIKLYNLLKRNIVVPQVCFSRKEDIGWEIAIPDMECMQEFTEDPWYNINLSEKVAYQLKY